MTRTTLQVQRRPETFVSDDRRVITRYLDFGDPARIRSILGRLAAIAPDEVDRQLEQTRADFAARHRDVEAAFRDHFQEVAKYLPADAQLSEPHRLLIGAYFTLEYSIESAALFNPSIVPHPDQNGVHDGSARFLMSLRATGEGHISSIVFHRGVIDPAGHIEFDPPPRYAVSAKPVPDKLYYQSWFGKRLRDMGVAMALVEPVMETLPEAFTLQQLQASIERVRFHPDTPHAFAAAAGDMLWLARANYELHFPRDCPPREIVMFPATENESRGMEDLRLVRFTDDDDAHRYYGTYTAFDGRRILPMLLETADFHDFHISTLGGRFVRNKGMALFPRKVGGQYLMVSRHDGESLFLLRSDDLYVWNHAEPLQAPVEPWELVQIGNSGSPVETEAGWLLLTHGVGPVRRYCLGAMLLDLDEPRRVIGRLREPLLVPEGPEREGYVPNVVYTCGAMRHGDQLIVPYAVSDVATRFATVPLHELVERLREDGP